MILESVLMILAVWAGTVPTHHQVPRAARHVQHAVHGVRTHAALATKVPLPPARPRAAERQTAPVPPVASALPVVQSPPAALSPELAPYEFIWRGAYALPPVWIQIWQFVG